MIGVDSGDMVVIGVEGDDWGGWLWHGCDWGDGGD